MAELIDYKGLKIVDPAPTGAGGVALNDNFVAIADGVEAFQAEVASLESTVGDHTTQIASKQEVVTGLTNDLVYFNEFQELADSSIPIGALSLNGHTHTTADITDLAEMTTDIVTTGNIIAGNLPDAPVAAPSIVSGGGGATYSAVYAFVYELNGRFTAVGPDDGIYDYYNGGQVIGSIPATPAGVTAVWLVRQHWDDDGIWRRIANVTGLTTYADNVAVYSGDDHTPNYEVSLSDGAITAQALTLSGSLFASDMFSGTVSANALNATFLNSAANNSPLYINNGRTYTTGQTGLNVNGAFTIGTQTNANIIAPFFTMSASAGYAALRVAPIDSGTGSNTTRYLTEWAHNGTQRGYMRHDGFFATQYVSSVNYVSSPTHKSTAAGGNGLTLNLFGGNFEGGTGTAMTLVNVGNISGTGATNGSGTLAVLKIAQTYTQTGTAASTDLLINRTQGALGSGTHKFLDCQIAGTTKVDLTNAGLMTFKSIPDGNSAIVIECANSNTQQLKLVRSSDQQLRVGFGTASDSGFFTCQYGSGTSLATFGAFNGSPSFQMRRGTTAHDSLLSFQTSTTSYLSIGHYSADSSDDVSIWTAAPSTTTRRAMRFSSADGAISAAMTTFSGSSGTSTPFSITPTINASGTHGYTAALVNVTETATGSGTKRLLDLQIGGASKASIDSAGQLRVASIGVGNSAAATTPGSVTKKIEVFDASGTSLGFVAVYDSIA